MDRVLVLSLFLTLAKAFMFDQLSDILKCKGITMLCPPMCQRQDARGCSTCDCSHIDPSHPKMPNNGNTGGNIDPSNPLSGHNKIPGSANCEDWTKCACVPTVNAETGCLECPCGQPQGNHVTKPTLPSIATLSSSTSSRSTSGMPLPVSSTPIPQPILENKTAISAIITTSPTPSVNTTGNQPKTISSLSGNTGTRPTPFSSTSPRHVTSDSTSAASTGFGSTNPSIMTSTKVDTNLPSIATVPALSTYTTVPALSTYTTVPALSTYTTVPALSTYTTVPALSTYTTVPALSTYTTVPALSTYTTVPALSTYTTVLATSTLAPFVCPGVFSCSLDCYAGFANDKNGCPQCKCAPIPTDLP